jgi:hypothetical protein
MAGGAAPDSAGPDGTPPDTGPADGPLARVASVHKKVVAFGENRLGALSPRHPRLQILTAEQVFPSSERTHGP